jgi:hypothetical protein
MSKYYYLTAVSGEEFINKFTKYSVKSLLRAGINPSDIYVAVNDKKDKNLIKNVLPEIKNIRVINEDLSAVVWKYSKGRRKYSLFKSASLYKTFPEPLGDRYMIYFDGDVLWYKNPSSFFDAKCDKTWFHHGKDLAERSKFQKSQIDVKDIDSLKQWCSEPQAHLMVKHGCKILPDREVVAGLYLLHPRDHAAVLKLTYEGCLENSTKFKKHEGGGDQKPMNAALSILEVDWHGGSRFFCPEHKEYFDHYFGKDNMKQQFWDRSKEMGL